jgi:hypothetical protein
MTEAEWQTCAEYHSVWPAVKHLLGDRKAVLYAVAGVRLAPRPAPLDVLDEAAEVAERAADGLAEPGEVERVNQKALALAAGYFGQPETRWSPVHHLAIAAEKLTTPPMWHHAPYALGFLWEAMGGRASHTPAPDSPLATVWQLYASILRDLVYNPYRDVRGRPLKSPRRLRRPPEVLKPGWRTADVIGLARGIYDDRALDRLPILADALQDAGCDNADVLDHCRSDGPHVRGCWVVDLVLGKS